jgi:hypothetical protein
MDHPNVGPVSARGQLQPGQRVDGYSVGRDLVDLAQRQRRAALLE